MFTEPKYLLQKNPLDTKNRVFITMPIFFQKSIISAQIPKTSQKYKFLEKSLFFKKYLGTRRIE